MEGSGGVVVAEDTVDPPNHERKEDLVAFLTRSARAVRLSRKRDKESSTRARIAAATEAGDSSLASSASSVRSKTFAWP